MNNAVVLVLVALSAIGFAFAWDYTRAQLVVTREELRLLSDTRAADLEAMTRLQSERDDISRRYEALNRELNEIVDQPSVDYLNTAVPDSVRKLLQR